MNQSEIRSYLTETLSHLTGRELNNLISYYLDAHQQLASALKREKLEKDIQALKEGIPVQYVTGITFFYGHRFITNSGCLIPRPETEELVHWIVKDNKSKSSFRIMDIGVGSGCILLSVMSALNNTELEGWGLDISLPAINVFNSNAKMLNLKVHPLLADIRMHQELPSDLDCIVSNPPYILSEERDRMDKSVLEYEPEIALFVPGEDPLFYYKRIMDLGLTLLKPQGVIYFETSDLYHNELLDSIDTNQYSPTFRRDLSGKWRMLKLTKLLPS